MPGDPLSRPLIEIARELRDRRASSDRVSHPKRIDASEENCGNLSRCAKQIADRGRHREQRGVLTGKTGDLQSQRQALDREQR